MKFRVLALAVVVSALGGASFGEVAPRNYYGSIARRLGNTLNRYHVLQQHFNDEMSCRAWTNLVSFYDVDHTVFLQSDLDRMSARRCMLDNELEKGDVSFGYDLYNLYVTRLKERINFATNLLATGSFDFSTNETYRIQRKDAPWPKTKSEAEELWRKRIKNELLAYKINRELDKATNEVDVAAELIKRHRQYVMVMTEPDEESVLQYYMSAVCRAYDPHTDYMSPTSKEDFDMEMNLSLCGVGAVLSMEEGALKIIEVMSGGPIDRDGRIKEGDKIVGVQQGDGEMEDVLWQPMKKSIRKIRGKKGTRVTLEIVPRSDPSGLTKKRIELVRDEIKLEDQAATGRVETVSMPGKDLKRKLGYVYLPSFYETIDKRLGDDGFRSCALDVAQYLADFNAQGVEGLILDLRGNGGGSLREAVILSSLFVWGGPVVQIRDVNRVMSLPIPADNIVPFHKPMVVLTDRSSASASEIVAGHLKDTGRAIVVGDRQTHGKGTVQSVMGLGPNSYGSCKVTTARFYRVNGRSTQVKGVECDIYLPSLLDSLDIGEDKLTYALPFSMVGPASYSGSWDLYRYISGLSSNSVARLAKNERYQRHLANVKGMRELSDREEVPLEYAARKAQMIRDRELRELDEELNENGDEEDTKKHRRKRNERKDDDVVLEESFRILYDLIEVVGDRNLPSDWGCF